MAEDERWAYWSTAPPEALDEVPVVREPDRVERALSEGLVENLPDIAAWPGG